jgi:hypothetical protein
MDTGGCGLKDTKSLSRTRGTIRSLVLGTWLLWPVPVLACDPTLIACSLKNFDDPYSNPRREEIYDHVGYGLLGNAVLGALVHASEPLPSTLGPAPEAGHRPHRRHRDRAPAP